MNNFKITKYTQILIRFQNIILSVTFLLLSLKGSGVYQIVDRCIVDLTEIQIGSENAR